MKGGEAENQERPDNRMSLRSSLDSRFEEKSPTRSQSSFSKIQEATNSPEPNLDLAQTGPNAMHHAVESRGHKHLLAPNQGETLNYYADPTAEGEQQVQKHIKNFHNDTFGPPVIWEPTREMLFCLTYRGPFPSMMHNLAFFPRHFGTEVDGSNKYSASIIIEVRGDFVDILGSLNLAEILDLFKGQWSHCLFDYPIDSTSIGVSSAAEATFMNPEPAKDQNGGGQRDTREVGFGNAGLDPATGALQLAHTREQDDLEQLKVAQQPNRKRVRMRNTDRNGGRVSKRRRYRNRKRRQPALLERLISQEEKTPTASGSITKATPTAPSPTPSSLFCSPTVTFPATTEMLPPQTEFTAQAVVPQGHHSSKAAGEIATGLLCTQCGMRAGMVLPSCFTGTQFTCAGCGADF